MIRKQWIFTLCQTSLSRFFGWKTVASSSCAQLFFLTLVGTIIPQANIVKTYVSHDHYLITTIAVYKTGTGTKGRGHWDACVGSCDLETRDEGLGDIRVWDAGTCGTDTRDVKYRDAETLMNIAKVGGIKCDISFFVKMCYLLSTLDSIVHHTGHLLWCLHKTFPYTGVIALTIVGKFTFANKIEAMYERSSVSVKLNFAQLHV